MLSNNLCILVLLSNSLNIRVCVCFESKAKLWSMTKMPFYVFWLHQSWTNPVWHHCKDWISQARSIQTSVIHTLSLQLFLAFLFWKSGWCPNAAVELLCFFLSNVLWTDDILFDCVLCCGYFGNVTALINTACWLEGVPWYGSIRSAPLASHNVNPICTIRGALSTKHISL